MVTSVYVREGMYPQLRTAWRMCRKSRAFVKGRSRRLQRAVGRRVCFRVRKTRISVSLSLSLSLVYFGSDI